MSRTIERAAAVARKDGKRLTRRDSEDDSDDSEDLAAHMRRKSRSREREMLVEKEKAKKLKLDLEAIKTTNKEAEARIVEARNDYPVLIVNVSPI